MTEQAFKAAEKFDPIFDRVLIKRDVSAIERRANAAGVLITTKTSDSYKSSEGTLIKCAPNCDESVIALTGKRILFARYSGDDITVGGEDYVLATDRDIFGALND
jgi:co-chaperonin GroES (HSP10)